MITYELRCGGGHTFEGWFKSLKTFEYQRKRNLIECPHCGSTAITLVYKAAVLRKRSLRNSSAAQPDAPVATLRQLLEKNFEDVGSRFPEEARRLHYGETEQRNIRGRATPDEERGLLEEGIPVVRIIDPKASN